MCITRVKGKTKHLGFSLQNAGRMDGMNEYGLVVTMSSTAYLNPLEGHECEFSVAIRALNSSIFEIASFSLNKKKITERKPVGDLILATNHYVSNEMQKFK